MDQEALNLHSKRMEEFELKLQGINAPLELLPNPDMMEYNIFTFQPDDPLPPRDEPLSE
ncbi:MAG: hypothetical protein IJ189_02845 [Clostridia bacterium]|nr:hypothetical protein [Clostridia bacterium]